MKLILKTIKVEKSKNENSLNYTISNLEPINKEPLSLSLKELLPNVKLHLINFMLREKRDLHSKYKSFSSQFT